jgi:hypothetical protein
MTRIDLILTGSERHGSRRVPHYSGFPIPDDIKTLIRERQRSRPLSLDVLEAIPLVLPVDYSNQVVAGQVMDLTPSLLRKVEEFGLGIAHRPHLAGRVIETFREAKKALEVVSDEEQVRFSCEKGVEDGSLEFKESFKRNKGTGKNDKVLSDRVFQVIVGMINTNGGLLLIGIHDETKEPTDLFEKEVLGAGKPKDSIGKCKDKFLNAFGNQFGACIGAEWHRSYSAAFVDYKGKPVFKVEVEKRPEGKFAYFEKKDPYIRTPTGSTEKPTHREWVDLTET